MKNLILAAVVAVTSVISFAPPMQAASITVQTDSGRRVVAPQGRIIIRDRDHRRDRRHMRRDRQRECHTEIKRYRNHGRVITKRVRVCESRY